MTICEKDVGPEEMAFGEFRKISLHITDFQIAEFRIAAYALGIPYKHGLGYILQLGDVRRRIMCSACVVRLAVSVFKPCERAIGICAVGNIVVFSHKPGPDVWVEFWAEQNAFFCIYFYRLRIGFRQGLRPAPRLFPAREKTGIVIGVCYENGEGVDKNLAEAAKWYRKVAEQGDANAQRNLGLYYIQEKRDNVRGYAWILLSVKNGLEDLTSKLAELEKQMDKGEIERAKNLAGEYSKGNFDK